MAPMSPTNGLNRRGIAVTNGLNPELFPTPGTTPKEVHAVGVAIVRVRFDGVE